VGQIVNLHVERLPEDLYLATSDDAPGLGHEIQQNLDGM
jgi:hypothetical protein